MSSGLTKDALLPDCSYSLASLMASRSPRERGMQWVLRRQSGLAATIVTFWPLNVDWSNYMHQEMATKLQVSCLKFARGF